MLKHLPLLLSVLTVAALAPACTSSTNNLSSKGQEITCTTQPGTGVILSCEPGNGSGSGSNTCHDIDEDGDGNCHDDHSSTNFTARDGGEDDGEGDHDGDGIPDSDDCDEHHGEDDSGEGGLPYDVRPQLGDTTTPIVDAFAEEGAQPAAITSVTMNGGTWRLAELQAGTSFVVTQADCDHVGNRDVGRDRVFVTWNSTANSVSQTDHLDIRYCK